MERESFEDENIAKFLKQHFVSIKVDREERPDVDKIYMTAVQAMGEGGGWPLNAFLTPIETVLWWNGFRRSQSSGVPAPPIAATDRGSVGEPARRRLLRQRTCINNWPVSSRKNRLRSAPGPPS
jgi:hypothetical protein